MNCFCTMRDGAHEYVCGNVGEYEYVHCMDCDGTFWMCEVSMSRCRSCRETYENSDAYKKSMEEARSQFLSDYYRGKA